MLETDTRAPGAGLHRAPTRSVAPPSRRHDGVRCADAVPPAGPRRRGPVATETIGRAVEESQRVRQARALCVSEQGRIRMASATMGLLLASTMLALAVMPVL